MRYENNMKLIVGLGNPDKKYLDTRHNVGFIIVDALASARNLNWQTNKDWQAMVAKDMDLLLVKPLTYMNDSGLAVRKIMDFYQLAPDKSEANTNLSEALIVIHDDLDIALGQYKVSSGSSSAGHNGIESIIQMLGTKFFTRYRIGIATPDLEKYRKSILGNRAHKFVLNRFPTTERKIIEDLASELISKLF